MPGVSLSRWTMAYFGAALVALLVGEGLIVAGFGYPAMPAEAPETLALVHIFTIGWLSLLLCGALFQFVPVLVAKPLYSDRLPLPALVLLLAGLGLLICGFLVAPGAFPYAATALFCGFALMLYDLARTLWAARPLPLAARFVVVALACLILTVLLGALFSFNFAGLVENDALLVLAANGLPLHVTAGLGGWLTLAAMGVSYRLLAMFMLAPELNGKRPRAVLWLGTLALAIALLGGIVLLLANAEIGWAFALGGVLAAVALGLYGADVFYLYKKRKRPVIELNSQMAIPAFASLAAAIVLAALFAALGLTMEMGAVLVFLLVFGWLSGLGLAKLYKITAFVTWLECYGPILGKAATPRVQDLVVEGQARGWFVLYYLSVWIATAMLALAQPLGFRLAVAGMLAATLAISVQLVRTRRLSNVLASKTWTTGVRRPRLLVVAIS